MKRLIAVILTVLMVASVCSALSFADEPVAADVNLVKGLDGGVKVYNGYSASLTDGVADEAITYDNKWFSLYRNVKDNKEVPETNASGKVGTFVYDLGENCTINKARVHVALCNLSSGVQAPRKITVLVSEDNKNYTMFATKSYDLPAKEAADVAWEELTGAARVGRYVKVEVELHGTFVFLNEIEVYGTKGGTAPTPVTPKITVDGKLDEAAWATASKVDTAIWQNHADTDPQPEIPASYKVLADDENIYVALTVADKWNYKDATYQTGATNFRIWMLGDTDYAHENERNFFDVTLKEDGTLALWYNRADALRKQDGTYKIEAKAANTANTEDVVVEFAINRSAIYSTPTGNFKMMVSYSSPAIAEEGKAAKYNALHISPSDEYVAGKDGKLGLPEGWSASAVMYQEFVYADGVVTKPGEGGDTSTDTSSDASSEASTDTSTGDTSSTGTNTPVTGDAGVIVLVVMAVVAAFGSAVLVKSRR